MSNEGQHSYEEHIAEEASLTKKQRREFRKEEEFARRALQKTKVRRDKASMALIVAIVIIVVAGLLVYLKRPVDISQVDTSADPVRGASNPKVVIQEYGDFQCGACLQAETALKQILEAYPDTVQLVFKDFPLRTTHLLAQAASEAAQCAYKQNTFWEYHDALYDQQTTWSSMSSTDFTNFLKTLATQVGVSDQAAFENCVDQRETRASVDADAAIGDGLRVQSTPTFFVNGERVVGAVPFAELQKIIEKKLSEIPQDAEKNTNLLNDPLLNANAANTNTLNMSTPVQ
ncbi:MAG: hypothetical protein A3B74_00260 [Candidatus Kerfeldbacteria bacterium RIFCSPHIGHO2_02_FULL_42_14]|uniref:Thioredoxin domain-containing protein n=1 Tax=Candidatus Kerfeldbacteria bacterium RIFCSPHIGHO2_02_FULL_42_14 TaxID=1798540 RepID=A0A1G2AQT9_9BACT|nr:MAG: hypothetical protein A3B74_00260 [Candidatus Kerfeldbacteria bacterium RIFCSPHIGHO2_02_FULL_42_14]OGY81291.1 MAG: hypothetical protein A3E60_02470 [Candidatus Kerfeldbacteria bacterium RIFCSPHIGHO2_12_FULL_42_13]OGY83566.1 MAG: hypothetical protein A3I91_02905 [Candidatus Kerfeldbacteria bacterium RIFCSPLOWO2_02_FULL_42_19]OGY86718.1 MAG: hypothetical protein A3G01_00715 [Candidatus Kerfeldbacteria bacterium RIFCSPLOWO2_12_FULL_43_9]